MDVATTPPKAAWRRVRLDQTGPAGADNALPLRHLASLMVIYGHSYDLTRPLTDGGDVVARLMPGFKSGNLAVYVFFVISGYLVMLSLMRHPDAWRYLRNRGLRIYPAYLVALLLCVGLLGPLFSSLPLTEYLTHPGTWEHLRKNLVPTSFSWTLPGVFVDNPFPNAVNGSLWSLGLEVRWYAYLGLLLLLGAVTRRWAFTSIALTFLAFGAWEWWQAKPDPLHYRALSMTFVTAALIAQWREHIEITHLRMLALLLLAAAVHDTRWFGPVAVGATIYTVLWAIYLLPTLGWSRERDYSYGLFLFGFPVQQALVALYPDISPAVMFLSASVLALLLAVASWHLVEAPMLTRKRTSTRPPTLGLASLAGVEVDKAKDK